MALNMLKGAIIFSTRSDVISVLRAELRDRKIEPVLTPEGVERAVEDLVRNPKSLLIIDWQVGVDKAIQVLEAVRNPLRIEIRPVFLFSAGEVEGLDGVCAEYGVLQMYSGEFTRNAVKKSLDAIEKAEAYDEAVQDGLVIVAESRRRDDWESAGILLKSLHEEFPQVDRLAVDLAENYFQLGNYEEAITLLAPITEGNNPDARALNLVGRIQLSMGEYQEASVTLQKAKVINPFNIERLISLGEAYINISMVDRAELNFRKAVDYGSKDERAIGGLGKSLLLGDKINEGLVFLKQLSGNREMASVFNSAAVLSMLSGRYVEGMKLYHVALETIRDDDKVHAKLAFNMGIGFHRNHDNDKAVVCFTVSCALNKNHAKAKQNLDALLKKGAAAHTLSEDKESWLRSLAEIEIYEEPEQAS